MRTIAISIDDGTVDAIDRLVKASDDPKMSRSKMLRIILAEFLERTAATEREAGDAQVVRANSERLARECAALLEDQAQL